MNTSNYAPHLKSFLTYQIGKINKYDTELFTYCRSVGFDLGDVLAIYFAHKRNEIIDILRTENRYDSIILTKILILKKLSAEQKFRDAYQMNSDSDINVLKEKERLWI